MRVTFYRLTEDRISYWEAVRGKRTRVPGTAMALGRGGMPHDLLQLLVEASVGIDDGFWASVENGATFKSTGRRRTKPGRAVIAANRDGLDRAERVVGDHLRRWSRAEPTPAAEALDDYRERWDALADGEGLSLEWPSLTFHGVERPTTHPLRG